MYGFIAYAYVIMGLVFFFFFFFSSRRRHTRFDCDWSSDVCSSDLFRGTPHWREDRGLGVETSQSRLRGNWRSEEHTSELQSQSNLVCRLLLEKKKTVQGAIVNTYDVTGPLSSHSTQHHRHIVRPV